MSNEPVPRVPALSQLTDDELTAAVKRIAADERASTAQLVAHLAEFDARRLHLAAGCPSLFRYCRDVLRLSDHATYNRIEAARAAARFPDIVDRIADGSLNLSTVRLLAPHLTDENHRTLLDEACQRSKRDVEEIVARVHPRPDVAARIRKLPTRLSAAAPSGAPFVASAPPHPPQVPPRPPSRPPPRYRQRSLS